MELTKVYVVMADNCEDYPEDHRHWIEQVFASEESAKKYIENEKRRFVEDGKRIEELEMLRDKRYYYGTYDSFEHYGLTEEEWAELRGLEDYWGKAWHCCPNYWIVGYLVNN